MTTNSSFGSKLRWWRERRGLSQLALAGQADISQRHLSFLELGRASPSREMIDRLAVVLEIPLRQHNALRVAAGFAPVWQQTDLQAPELAQITRAIEFMLVQQDPYPAVVVDRQWNLLRANAGAQRLIAFFVGPLPADAEVNLADALVAPDILRPYLVNWPDVVRHFVQTVDRDATFDGLAATNALLERLLAYDGVRGVVAQSSLSHAEHTPVLAMHFQKDETSLQLFTTIATLGTPQNVTLQELRIECFFPMDEVTAQVLHSWAE